MTTARMVVTTWVPGDVDDLLTLHSDPQTMRFVGPGRPEARPEVEQRLETYLLQQRVQGWTKWRVQDHDGVMVGRAGFGGFEQHREVGYTLSPRVWGQGWATELLTALVGWHRYHLVPEGGSELWAFAMVDNATSRRVLSKVGFEHVGYQAHNDADCALYVIDRSASEHPQ